jgi:hypothetical protein
MFLRWIEDIEMYGRGLECCVVTRSRYVRETITSSDGEGGLYKVQGKSVVISRRDDG